MIKKTNAIVSLIAFAVNTVHCITKSLSMLFPDAMPSAVLTVLGLGTLLAVVVHIVLSLISLFVLTDTHGTVSYPKKNFEIAIQRITAFASLLFMILHVVNGLFHVLPSFTLILAVSLTFILLIEAHIAVSVPRALLTLGLVCTQKGCIKSLIASYGISLLLMIFSITVFMIEIAGM